MVLAEVLNGNSRWCNRGIALCFNINIQVDALVAIFTAICISNIISRFELSDYKTPPITQRIQYTTQDKIRIGQALRELVQYNTTITWINFSETNWGDIVATKLAIGLQSNTSIYRFNYCSNQLQNNGLIEICNILKY